MRWAAMKHALAVLRLESGVKDVEMLAMTG